MAIAASGWLPANVKVISSHIAWGSERESSVVQLTIQNDLMFAGASDSNQYGAPGYFPAPGPSLVGLTSRIEYIIPLSPFFLQGGNGRMVPWGYSPPTGAAAAGYIRMQGAFGAGDGPTYPLEIVSEIEVSTFMTTNVMVAYGLFVGG